jgi:tetratricopeptide (TPR) repeat protein
LAGEWLLENGEGDPVVLAEHFAGSGAVEQAIDWFQRAADSALGDSTGSEAADEALRQAATYFRRAAEVCAATYANENAIAFYERASALWAPLDAVEAGRTRAACARLLERAGHRDKAARELELAEEEASRGGDIPTKIEILLARSEAEKRTGGGGSLDRAWNLAEHARDLAQSVGARELEAKALTGMAAVLWSHETEESSQKALQLARIAVSITTEHGDLPTRLWRLGNGFLLRNDLDRATLLYRDALALAERAHDEMLAALCRASTGMAQFRRWNLDAAIEETQRALAAFQRVGSRVRIAEMKLNLGAFWVKRGNFAAAVAHLNDVLSGAAGDWILTTASLDSLAQFERHHGNERTAQQHLSSAARLCEQVGVPQRHALFLGMLAESYWASGDHRKATDCLERAVAAAEAPTLSHPLVLAQLGALDQAAELLEQFRDADPDPDRRSAARLALARVHWWHGDVSSARKRCADALEVLSPTPLPRFVLPAEALMACLDGQPALAQAALRAARAYCSPAAYDEVAADVGTCLVQLGREVAAEDLEKFLAATMESSNEGVRFRVLYLRARVHELLGQTARAREIMMKARVALQSLATALPTDFAETVLTSDWADAILRETFRVV